MVHGVAVQHDQLKKNDWDDDEKDEEEDQAKSDDTLINLRGTKEDVTC